MCFQGLLILSSLLGPMFKCGVTSRHVLRVSLTLNMSLVSAFSSVNNPPGLPEGPGWDVIKPKDVTD